MYLGWKWEVESLRRQVGVWTQKGGFSFGPPPHLPQNQKKLGFKWAGVGGGGSDQRLIKGCVYWTKIMVQYANRPKKAQKGSACGVYSCIRLLGFDQTTSAR